MFNKLKETPKTGDSTNPTLWYALMGIAGVSAVVCGVLGFKKRKKEDE